MAAGGGGGGGGGERKGPENTHVYTQEELGLALSQSVKMQETPSSLEGGRSAMDCTSNLPERCSEILQTNENPPWMKMVERYRRRLGFSRVEISRGGRLRGLKVEDGVVGAFQVEVFFSVLQKK